MFSLTALFLQLSMVHFGFFGHGDNHIIVNIDETKVSQLDNQLIDKDSNINSINTSNSINYMSIFLFVISSFFITLGLKCEHEYSQLIPTISTIDDLARIGMIEADNRFVDVPHFELNTRLHDGYHRPSLAALGKVCNIYLRVIDYNPLYYLCARDFSAIAHLPIHIQTLFNFVSEVKSYHDPELNKALNYLLVHGQPYACYMNYPVTSQSSFLILKRLCMTSYLHWIDVGLVSPELKNLLSNVRILKYCNLFWDWHTLTFLKLY
jgi:hypothetical protein